MVLEPDEILEKALNISQNLGVSVSSTEAEESKVNTDTNTVTLPIEVLTSLVNYHTTTDLVNQLAVAKIGLQTHGVNILQWELWPPEDIISLSTWLSNNHSLMPRG